MTTEIEPSRYFEMACSAALEKTVEEGYYDIKNKQSGHCFEVWYSPEARHEVDTRQMSNDYRSRRPRPAIVDDVCEKSGRVRWKRENIRGTKPLSDNHLP